MKLLATLAIPAHHVAARHENDCWTMFLANGASDASTTGTLWRWFLGACGISHRPFGTHFEIHLQCMHPLDTYSIQSQLHQHGPQLPLCDIHSSGPLLDLFTHAHENLALVLLILGCLPACLLEPLLRFGNQRINQVLRFAPSLCGGLAQLLKEGHGFEGTGILWPCKSGRKVLGQKHEHMIIDTASRHQQSHVRLFSRFFNLQPMKTVSFQCPLFHW